MKSLSSSLLPFQPAGVYVPASPPTLSVSSSLLSPCAAKYILAKTVAAAAALKGTFQTVAGGLREVFRYLIKRRLSPLRAQADKIILSGSTMAEVLMLILTLT